jgi:hypothetical protein
MLLAALLLLTATVPIAAKGRTVKIVITGDSLAAPIEITGHKAAAFHIWAGPGVFVNGVEQTEGFIIDWKRGSVEPPTGVAKLQVSFYTGCDRREVGCNSETPQLAYLITYAWRNGAKESGFVYLPGPQDEAARTNIVMTHGHGYEGHWLHANAAWDELVKPLLVKK